MGALSLNPWTFGGCDNWATLAAETIATRNYFTMRKEQRCNFKWHCHYVVVLENSRTSEIHVVDAWSYAGGWIPGMESPSQSIWGDYNEFKTWFGDVKDRQDFAGTRCN